MDHYRQRIKASLYLPSLDTIYFRKSNGFSCTETTEKHNPKKRGLKGAIAPNKIMVNIKHPTLHTIKSSGLSYVKSKI